MALVPSPMSLWTVTALAPIIVVHPVQSPPPLYFLLQDSLEQLSPVGIVIVIKSSGFIS